MQDEQKHIFYTDDDEDDQELFRGALGEVNSNIPLTVADDGDALLHLLVSPPPEPHLIFLDLNMPRKNGYEALQAIRDSEKLKRYPVVVFSTSSDPVAIAKTRELGANMFITKPRSYNEIKKVLQACMDMDWAHHQVTDDNYILRA